MMSDDDAGERDRKRVKIDRADDGSGHREGGAGGKKNWSSLKTNDNESQSKAAGDGHTTFEGQSKSNPKAKSKSEHPHSASGGRSGWRKGSTFSASGLHSGDVGIFVTCDKGMEKKALRELEDVLGEIIGDGGVESLGGDAGNATGNGGDGIGGGDGERVISERNGDALHEKEEVIAVAGVGGVEGDIESEIRAELREMRGKGHVEPAANARRRTDFHDRDGVDGFAIGSYDKSTDVSKSRSTNALGLVTLDIPCVSFVRLPQPHSQISEKSTLSNAMWKLDPVSLVYALCRAAYQDPLRQRSRYIKRLTPVSRVRKVLGEGLERLCAEVLDDVFGARPMAVGKQDEGEDETRGWNYAIRVTVRNNNQVSKEEIINTVAGYVVAVGKGDASGVGNQGGRDGGNTSSEDESDGNETSERRHTIEDVNTKPSHLVVPREHKVDLKNFEKLILVEVYRNAVGMSVVGDAKEYDGQLRKFNMAEIYAEGRKRLLKDMEEREKNN